jgi:ammonium transporter, Amt family
MNLIPGLSLRASEEDEVAGIDDAQLGEFAYDYVELRRETNALIVGEEGPASSKVSSDVERAQPVNINEKA